MAKKRREDPLLEQIREPLLARIDRRLALILGGSLAVHIGLAAYAWSTDIPEPQIQTAPPTTAYQEIDLVIPDLAAPAPRAQTPGTAAPVSPNQTPRSIVHRPTARPQITTSSQVDPSQLDGLFTAPDATRRPGIDLGKQIIDVRDHHVEIGTDRTPNSDDDRLHIGTRDESPITNNPTLTHAAPAHADEPHGRIIPGQIRPETDATTLTPALVLARIESDYMSGLQRCYRLGLSADGQLSGKVAIEFTVDARGQVSDPDASGVSPQVDSCIRQQMTRWRFPVPKDKQGNATDASFAVSLALQPS